jgi:hypothetical protein
MANLERAPGYLALKPGDPWTFLLTEQEYLNAVHNIPVGSRTIHSFNDNESMRVFRIVRIDDTLHAAETVYLGFEVESGTRRVEGEVDNEAATDD